MRAKLESIVAQDYPREQITVVVVSDGSSDQSVQVAREFAGRHSGIQVFEIPAAGKAAALNAAFDRCAAEILVLTDVRQPLSVD